MNKLESLRLAAARRPGHTETKFFTALATIANHVHRECGGNPDAVLNGGDMVEVVGQALRGADLWPVAPSHPGGTKPLPVGTTLRERIVRACHDVVIAPDRDGEPTLWQGRALFAVPVSYADGSPAPGTPVCLARGEGLGVTTRAGAVLARLLAQGNVGEFHVVSLRHSGAKPGPREREAAARIKAAARLVDLPVAEVVLLAGRTTHVLEENAPDDRVGLVVLDPAAPSVAAGWGRDEAELRACLGRRGYDRGLGPVIPASWRLLRELRRRGPAVTVEVTP